MQVCEYYFALHGCIQSLINLRKDIYWTAFPSDQWHTKALVYTLFVLDSLQSILLARDGFSIFAEGFGNVKRLNEIGDVWFTIPVLAALGQYHDIIHMLGLITFFSIVSLIVECFFAYRIWVLSGRSPWIPAAVVAVWNCTQHDLVFTNNSTDVVHPSSGCYFSRSEGIPSKGVFIATGQCSGPNNSAFSVCGCVLSNLWRSM